MCSYWPKPFPDLGAGRPERRRQDGPERVLHRVQADQDEADGVRGAAAAAALDAGGARHGRRLHDAAAADGHDDAAAGHAAGKAMT